MFQRSTTLVPLIRTCCGAAKKPVQFTSRNIWDLVSARPRDVFAAMDREMERLERNLLRNMRYNLGALPSILPRNLPVYLEEDGSKKYRVNIDVEGHKPDDIKVSVKDNVVRIEAKMDRTSEDGNSRLQQTFTREFTVPENVDLSTLKSFLRNDGVLCIEGGLAPEEAPKEIPIQHDGEAIKSKM